MPNSATASRLVETATTCFAIALSSPPSPSSSHCRGAARVRHRLDGGERLRGDDHERLRRIEVAEGLHQVGRVDVRDEPQGQAAVGVGAERLVRHRRTEVRPADPDVDDCPNALPGMAEPVSGAHALSERGHPIEHLVDVADDVPAVHDQRAVARHAQRHMEGGPVLGAVHVLAAIHRVAPLGHASRRRELDEQRDRLGRDPVLREVGVDPRRLERQAIDAARVFGEEIAQVPFANGGVVPVERLPRRAGGDGVGHLPGRVAVRGP